MAEIVHNKGEAGGYLVGNRHSEGGIKAINKSTGQPLEMEGGEVVITRNAVSDTTKRSFNGKMMTNREILSSINKSGGGVEFEEGGEVPSTIEYIDALMEYDGEQSDSRKVLEKMAVGGQVSDILDDLKSIYAEGGQAPNADILELESIDSGLVVQNLTIVPKNPDGTFDLDTTFALDDLDEGLLDALSEEDLVKIDLAANGSNQTIGRLLTQKRITQGGVAPQLEPLRQINISLGFIFTDNGGKFNEFRLKNGFLDIPTLIERNFLSFSGGDFSLVVIAKLYTDNNQESIVANLNYNINNLDSYTYSYFRDSVILELKKNALFTKPFQDLYSQANKLYCTGLYNSQILTNSTPDTILGPGTFTQVFPKNTSDYDLGSFELEPENEFLNFQSFEKLAKKLIAKKVTNFVLRSSLELQIASVNGASTNFSSAIVVSTDDFINGKGLPKKWNWWKENIFAKQGMFSQKTDVLSFTNFLDDIDFAPFECEDVNPKQKKRSGAQKQLREKLIVKGSDANEIYVHFFGGDGGEIISPPFELTFLSRSRFDVYANISYDILRLGKISSEVRFDAERTLFVGDKGIFHFGYKENIIFTFDQQKVEREKLERAELARLEKEKRAEEQKLLREQKKLEQEKELALKNRPFKVRDQQKDLDFFPLQAARGAFENEINALKVMLNFTQSAKMRDERAAIIQKISALERKDAKMALKALNMRPGETLMSPENLLDYYYTQATQSPIVQLGPPCGLSTPSGEPSKLPLQSYHAVRTPFFKNWFGDWETAYATGDYSQCSMLVDEDTGEPKMMYHGVRQYVEGFETGNMGKGVTRPYAEFSPPNFPATYFGDNVDYVRFYAGMAENQFKPTQNYEGYIYSVFIKMLNPVVLVDLGLTNQYDELLAYIQIYYGVKIEPSKKYSDLFLSRQDLKVWNYVRYDINLLETLKSAGYDGIIQVGDVPAFDEDGNTKTENLLGNEYLVFDATQVKDASVKNSFYLPFIKDIRFKEGGNVRL